MELLNSALKKYINLSILEILLFSLSGLAIFYIFEIPTFLPFLNNSSGVKDLSSFPNNLFFLLFWLLIFLLGKRVLTGIFKFVFSFKSYKFKSKDWPNNWIYQGNIRLWEEDNNFLYVTDSNSGGILKHHYWKNLEINFECMFPPGSDDQTIGIIFRAKSLSDYLMVQINDKEKQIVPHVRMEGRWETPRRPKYEMSFERNNFFDVKLRIINEKVELFIRGTKLLDWNIPTNSDLTSADKEKRHVDTIVPIIDFRQSYGMIGFRAYQGEGGVIKNLSVKRIADTV